KANCPIGIVEKIAAPSTLRIQLTGVGGHAGAVLMPDRHDALLAGAEIALAVERAAKNSGSPDTVGTTGVFRIEPGAVNSVPRRGEPSAGRVFLAGTDREWRRCAGAHAGQVGGVGPAQHQHAFPSLINTRLQPGAAGRRTRKPFHRFSRAREKLLKQFFSGVA